MSELTLTLLRMGLLALLWLFVFSVVRVLRSDLYGTRVSRRRVGRGTRGASEARGTPTPASVAPPGAAYGPGGIAGTGQPAPPPGARGRAARALPRTLVVTEGRLAGTTLPLGSNGILIGRNPECALVLDDDFASGRHARVFPRDGAWFVEDLGSTNGTFLGASRLSGAVPVTIGTTLRIGRTVLELQG